VAGDEEESSDDGEPRRKVPTSSKGAIRKKGTVSSKGNSRKAAASCTAAAGHEAAVDNEAAAGNETAADNEAAPDNNAAGCSNASTNGNGNETAADNEAAPDNNAAGCSNASTNGNRKKTVKKTVITAAPPQGEIRVYMDPPDEKGDGDTDVDSDDSDEPDGIADHLPRRLLKAGAQKRTKQKSAAGNRLETVSSEEEDDDVPAVNLGKWSKTDSGLVGSKVPPYIKPLLDMEKEEWVEQLEEASAFDYYRVFQPPNFVQEVVYQSKLYAVQKNKKMSLDTMNEDTYRYLPTL